MIFDATKTKIDKHQAIALFDGRKNLLPKPGEVKRQLGDSSGRHWIGQTQGGEFYTEHRVTGDES